MSNSGANKHNVSNAPSADASGLVWSPDSTRLAFLSDRDDAAGIYDIFVVNNDGTGLANLTNSTDSDEWSLDWSPDGTKIVYLSDLSLQPGLIGHIVTMNADGTNKTTIATNSGFNLDPAWSPDGSKIAFILKGFVSDCLALMNPDGTNQSCATSYDEIEYVNRGIRWNSSGATSQWSADSKQLVYNNGDFFLGHEIYIINTNGSGNTNLTNSENVDDRWPDWSPIPLLLP